MSENTFPTSRGTIFKKTCEGYTTTFKVNDLGKMGSEYTAELLGMYRYLGVNVQLKDLSQNLQSKIDAANEKHDRIVQEADRNRLEEISSAVNESLPSIPGDPRNPTIKDQDQDTITVAYIKSMYDERPAQVAEEKSDFEIEEEE